MSCDVRDILEACSTLAPDAAVTLATVIGTSGSSYRRPGARMLIVDGKRVAGSVSGGCLERDLARRGAWLARAGPRRLVLDTAADPDEVELGYPGCGGTIELLIENTTAGAAPLSLLRWARARGGAHLVTVLEPATDEPRERCARAACSASGQRTGDPRAQRWFDDAAVTAALARAGSRGMARVDAGDGTALVIEGVAGPRELLVAGRHHDVAPVVGLGRALGWRVTVAGSELDRANVGTPDAVIAAAADAVSRWADTRPDAAVVLMTHSVALDRELLAALAGRPLAYLGLLGPRHRAADIFGELHRRGIGRADTDRVCAPVGLDLGGDGPEAIALSIVAHIQARFAGRDASPTR